MNPNKSLTLSVIVHLTMITVAIVIFTLPTHETEEEVVLELTLNTPQEVQRSVSKPIPVPTITPQKKQEVSEVKHDPFPIQPQAKITEPIIQPTKAEPVVIAQKIPEPQLIQPTQVRKLEPVTPPTPAAPKPSAEEEYLENHLSAIRDTLIKYRKYPKNAVRLRQEGAVRVSFRLTSSGEVEDITIQSSSGYEILDDDAKVLIEKTAHYFPKPPKTVRITVPLSYSLKMAP
ncbi:MAG: TonB family protein [Sulfuricurvum sp.]|nr:TonB family protein [Sulfuricurvum sp.]